MGKSFRIYLAGESVYCCKKCGNHLAVSEGIISKQFTGKFGNALLIEDVVNVSVGDVDDRMMRTGRHIVRDIFCSVCDEYLGWRYDKAFDDEQLYKEGKFILERAVIKEKHESKTDFGPLVIEEVPPRELLARI